jgi:hypothetical protein
MLLTEDFQKSGLLDIPAEKLCTFSFFLCGLCLFKELKY